MTISFNRVQGHKQNNMNLLQIPFSEWNKSMVWTDTGVLWLESEVITFNFCLSCAKENALERSWLFLWLSQSLLFLQYYHILHIKTKQNKIMQRWNKPYLQAIKTMTLSPFTTTEIWLCRKILICQQTHISSSSLINIALSLSQVRAANHKVCIAPSPLFQLSLM